MIMDECVSSENNKLCTIGTCELCLIVNLYVRYVRSKKTITPTEILGFTASKNAEENSIDHTYNKLIGAIKNDATHFHPQLKMIKLFHQLNMKVSIHKEINFNKTFILSFS